MGFEQGVLLPSLIFDCFQVLSRCYLRPVSGCTSGGCVRAGGATICLGLLTFVLDFANSNRMVWGRSGSNLTPCCKKTGVRHGCWCSTHGLDRVAREMWSCETSFPALIVGQVKLTGGRKGAKSCLFWLVWPLRQVSATIWAARLFFVRRQLLQEAPCLLPWVA